MTGRLIRIGRAQITPDGKVKPKANTYKQRNKALKTARKAAQWAKLSKKS